MFLTLTSSNEKEKLQNKKKTSHKSMDSDLVWFFSSSFIEVNQTMLFSQSLIS